MHRKRVLIVLALAAMGCASGQTAATPPTAQIQCGGVAGGEAGPRDLLGACNVDTEHHVSAQRACYVDSGVRRYASSNDPADVEADCRAGILELAAEFCEKNPDEQNWQASWVTFKESGEPATGSEMLFGTCKPLTVTRDEWAANIQNL